MTLLRNSQPHLSYASYDVQGWVQVKDRGVFSFIGLALLALMIWGFGITVVKGALAALAVLAQPAVSSLISQGSAKLLWAAGDGLAVGLLVVLLQRAWLAYRRRNFYSEPRTTRQATPMLAAGLAAGLMALALNVGALPTAMMSGSELDLTAGIPALLESAHLLSIVGGAGPGGGGGPYPDLLAGWGAMLALLVVLIVVAALAGGIVGGGLGAIGLGAVSGAAESATSRAADRAAKKTRAGPFANAINGATSGAFVGAVAAVLSMQLTCAFSAAQHWAVFVVFDIVATITAAILMLLCRRSWENPTGLVSNVIEAGKVVILLIQCALGLAIGCAILVAAGGIVLGVLFLLKWLFS